jgi:heat shock protein HtpX
MTVTRHANAVKTALLLAALGALFVVAGSALTGTTGGLLLGLAVAAGSYWFSDAHAIRAAGARPVSEAEQPGLYRVVRDVAVRRACPCPGSTWHPARSPTRSPPAAAPDTPRWRSARGSSRCCRGCPQAAPHLASLPPLRQLRRRRARPTAAGRRRDAAGSAAVAMA